MVVEHVAFREWMTRWDATCDVHREVLGELWGAGDDLLRWHGELLPLFARSESLSGTQQLAVTLAGTHGLNLAANMMALVVRGQLDVSRYLRRSLFDVLSVFPALLADADFAEQFLEDSEHLPARARREHLFKDSDLRQELAELNMATHVSWGHLLMTMADESRKSLEEQLKHDPNPTGTTLISFDLKPRGSVNSRTVRSAWLEIVMSELGIVALSRRHLGALVPDDIDEGYRIAAVVVLQELERDNQREGGSER